MIQQFLIINISFMSSSAGVRGSDIKNRQGSQERMFSPASVLKPEFCNRSVTAGALLINPFWYRDLKPYPLQKQNTD